MWVTGDGKFAVLVALAAAGECDTLPAPPAAALGVAGDKIPA